GGRAGLRRAREPAAFRGGRSGCLAVDPWWERPPRREWRAVDGRASRGTDPCSDALARATQEQLPRPLLPKTCFAILGLRPCVGFVDELRAQALDQRQRARQVRLLGAQHDIERAALQRGDVDPRERL